MSKKMAGDSPIEYSFKNKGPAKTQAPSSSINSVGAEFCRCQRSWSRGDHDHHRDLQGKSKLELGGAPTRPSDAQVSTLLQQKWSTRMKF